MSFYTFNGYKCIANDMYKLIMGFGPYPHSLCSLTQTIYTRSSPFALLLHSITNSRLSLDAFRAPHRHIRVNPIPIFTRSSLFAHFATLNREESAFSQCRAFTPIDLYHIITMHMKPMNLYNP